MQLQQGKNKRLEFRLGTTCKLHTNSWSKDKNKINVDLRPTYLIPNFQLSKMFPTDIHFLDVASYNNQPQ